MSHLYILSRSTALDPNLFYKGNGEWGSLAEATIFTEDEKSHASTDLVENNIWITLPKDIVRVAETQEVVNNLRHVFMDFMIGLLEVQKRVQQQYQAINHQIKRAGLESPVPNPLARMADIVTKYENDEHRSDSSNNGMHPLFNRSADGENSSGDSD